MSKTITFTEGLAIMVERGYDQDHIEERWRLWLGRGDHALIFVNNDLSHPGIGHAITMPWAAEDPEPPHAPDHPAIGLGWRYTTDYRINTMPEEAPTS